MNRQSFQPLVYIRKSRIGVRGRGIPCPQSIWYVSDTSVFFITFSRVGVRGAPRAQTFSDDLERFDLLFFLEFAGRSGEVNLARNVKVFAKILGLDLEKEKFYS